MNDAELLRYSRHILLPEVDVAGQQRWCAATVLIIGVGGLGSAAVMYLAAAGIGHLILCDPDQVDISNLQRQIIHRQDSLGLAKVDSAAAVVHALNPAVRVTPIVARLDGDELRQIVAQADVVLDCSDNFATRFAVNAACVVARKPLVSAAAIRMEGQISVFAPGGPCYRCLYHDQGQDEESCTRNGVLAPLVGVMGSLQAFEALKLLANIGDSLVGKLLLFDGKHMEWRRLNLRRDPACPVCSGL
jgi:molybdopterin-synthase adenylyltransferase